MLKSYSSSYIQYLLHDSIVDGVLVKQGRSVNKNHCVLSSLKQASFPTKYNYTQIQKESPYGSNELE